MKKLNFREWANSMSYIRTGNKFYGPGGSIYSQYEIKRQYDTYCNHKVVK